MQESLIDQQISFSSIGYSSNKLQCFEKNEAIMICANPQCRQSPYVCSSDQCKCNMLHETCLLVSSQSLTKKIELKMIDPTAIMDEINRIVDRCIDDLSDWRDKLLAQVKYYGLTDMEKQYLIAVHLNNIEDINGQMVSQIVKSVITPNEKNKVMQAIKLIQGFWEKQKENFHSIFKNLEGVISVTPSSALYRQLSSNIVESNQQFKTLCSFFPQKIKNFNYLYRGSLNYFNIKDFYRTCSLIPQTLVLVHTRYGKKIGGFTTCKWGIRNWNQFEQDWLKNSFIFSLTNGDKFPLIQPTKAIQYVGGETGPRFGWGDLSIGNDSHCKATSYTVFNNCYFNQKYKINDSESYRKFTGGQTEYFRIKEWEVYEVIFAD